MKRKDGAPVRQRWALCATVLAGAALLFGGAAHGQTNTIQFHGTNCHVNIPHGLIPDWEQVWGFEAWINPSSVSVDRYTIINLRGDDTDGEAIDFYAYIGLEEGHLGFYNGSHSETYGDFQAGQWQHVAIMFDGSDMLVYQDGAFVGSQSANLNFSSFPDEGGSIGASLRAPATYLFAGQIADVRLWRGVIPSEAEIAARMNQRLQGDEPGLLAYWRFDEGTGDALDSTGNGHHGTLGGGAVWVESPDLDLAPAGIGFLQDLRPVVAAAGQTITLGPVELADPEGQVTYQWYVNDEPIDGATESSLILSDISAADEGEYHVVVDDDRDATPIESNRITVQVWESVPAAGLMGLFAAGGALAFVGLARIRRRGR